VAKHRVTVTQEPRVVRIVDDAELIDLDRQGLIYSSESGDYGRHTWREPEPDVADVEPPAPVTATKTDTKKGA
jgi:hypothetical protein